MVCRLRDPKTMTQFADRRVHRFAGICTQDSSIYPCGCVATDMCTRSNTKRKDRDPRPRRSCIEHGDHKCGTQTDTSTAKKKQTEQFPPILNQRRLARLPITVTGLWLIINNSDVRISLLID
jgi:hypothetical protein